MSACARSPYKPDDLIQLKRKAYKVKGVLDKIVRVDRISHRERHKFARKYFYRWRRSYGINVPSYQIFNAGKIDGRNVTHIVTERIYGVTLDGRITLPAKSRRAIDQLLTNLFQAILDAYKRREPLCQDMALRQFMYGHQHRKREKMFHLVDLDPWFMFYSPRKSKLYNHCFWFEVYRSFPSDIRRAERWLGGTLLLTSARQKLSELRAFVKQKGIRKIAELC